MGWEASARNRQANLPPAVTELAYVPHESPQSFSLCRHQWPAINFCKRHTKPFGHLAVFSFLRKVCLLPRLSPARPVPVAAPPTSIRSSDAKPFFSRPVLGPLGRTPARSQAFPRKAPAPEGGHYTCAVASAGPLFSETDY